MAKPNDVVVRRRKGDGLIDFSSVKSVKKACMRRGGTPKADMPYVLRTQGNSNGKVSRMLVLPQFITDEIIRKYGIRVGVGYRNNGEIIISNNDKLATRKISMLNDSVSSHLGISCLNDLLDSLFGNQANVIYEMTRMQNGYVFKPRQQSDQQSTGDAR